MISQQRNYLISIIIILGLLLADQFIKVKSILSFNYFLNQNTFLGLFKNNSLGIVLLVILILLVIYLALKQQDKIIIYSVIFAGLGSNLVDRAIHHGVIDYWILFRSLWFNLADLAIVVGLAFLVNSIIQTKKSGG